ncbi:MAG: exodeoxyribonuclease VII large subunit, partial [Gemmatimonadetes bacterium]|nr:exodeoxyribonuclease VII large subunit [Gemmatimonadota bacterium]
MRSRRASGPSASQGDLGLAGASDAVAAPDDARPFRAAATPGATPESAVSIATLTQTAKAVLEGAFQPLWIRGEVSNFTAHRNGHWYFTLKDQESQLRCVVWSRDNARLPASPDDGMEVCAYGRLSMYTARGEIQFVITRLEAAGEGLWRKAFEQVRRRLEADGLLSEERKRPLPLAPRRIACITSATGAAFHDIVAVTRRRSPATELVLVPAQVQGETAAASLIAALDLVTRWRDCDLVIIGRGGGSREDLWCFNDEALCRAVASFPIPIISAVGHEVDVSLCDLVADWRAPTPSAAAERAVPDHMALVATVRALGLQLRASLERRAR